MVIVSRVSRQHLPYLPHVVNEGVLRPTRAESVIALHLPCVMTNSTPPDAAVMLSEDVTLSGRRKLSRLGHSPNHLLPACPATADSPHHS
ncbi:hypothetical protein E2C01_082004 [Portunus trituberculatus]|uniref:Uncharacterized protein n=1 Tax=Portunus trituberculatus TaxID=210409 RepID=A0A5B7ITC9_PORTR|nr:hypothetical protein [Portunus trituberculatus]